LDKGRFKTTVRSDSRIRDAQALTCEDFFLKKYPNVLGTDVAGEVHEVGEGVTHVKKGDRVLGYVLSRMRKPLY
jgi:NADPH:quinone reductase-like Zn-dependent oxidoreductase